MTELAAVEQIIREVRRAPLTPERLERTFTVLSDGLLASPVDDALAARIDELLRVLEARLPAGSKSRERAREATRQLANVRAPTAIIRAFGYGRSEGGELVKAGNLAVESGIAASPDLQCLRVVPPQGVSLLLPFGGQRVRRDGKTCSLRDVLGGAQHRDYLALWAAWIDNGADVTGLFAWDERAVLGTYFEAARVRRGRSDDAGLKFHTKTRLALRRSMDLFKRIGVSSVGDVDANRPEALVQEYRKRDGSIPPVFRHAPILMAAMRSHFVQYPRAILQLEPSDAPLAMGIALLVRERATAMIEAGGSYEAPLVKWLDAASEDYRTGARKYGRDYWRRMSERAVRVAGAAQLGTVTVTGTGHETIAKLVADAALLEAYRPLYDAHVALKQRAPGRSTRKLGVRADANRAALLAPHAPARLSAAEFLRDLPPGPEPGK